MYVFTVLVAHGLSNTRPWSRTHLGCARFLVAYLVHFDHFDSEGLGGASVTRRRAEALVRNKRVCARPRVCATEVVCNQTGIHIYKYIYIYVI